MTAFHLALTALDPAVWEAARNSLLLAAATTLGAWAFGIGLAWLGRRRFRGRTLLRIPLQASMAVAPLFAALGFRGGLDRLGLGPESLGGWAGWLAALAAEWTWAVPLVALAAGRALLAIDPTWEDAVRLAGGGRRRAWWRVFRPVIRPHAARAAAAVFALTLAEPGAPIVLGRRRTLAYQLVQAALRPDAPNRASALALLAVGLAAVAGWLLVRGHRVASRPSEPSPRPPRPANRGRAIAATLGLGAWAVFAFAPVVGLAALVVGSETAGASPHGRLSEGFGRLLDDPDIPRLIGHSALLGGAVASFGLLAAWGLSRSWGGQGGGGGERVLGGVSRMPPLALAVGGVMVPGLLGRLFGNEGVAGELARGLDPVRSPGVLLGLVLLGFHGPALLATVAALRERSRPVWFEAARTLGALRWRAWRTLTPPLVGPLPLAAWSRMTVIAGLDLAATLVLTPSSIPRTLGPGVLDLASQPEGLSRAAGLALIGMVAGIASLALAARRGLTALIEEPPR